MISGEKRQSVEDFGKKIGIGEFRVIAINPSMEEFSETLGITLSEDSKAAEYLGERDGNTTLRVSVWLEEVNTNFRQSVNFFLEDKIRENKEGTKRQYISNIGTCCWADSEENLPTWFTKRPYREAHSGEEELYEWLRNWLGTLDYKSLDTEISLDWKKLMKGNVSELRDQIDGEYCTNFLALITVVHKEKDGEVKQYQNIYNKSFLPAYYMKYFRTANYNDISIQSRLKGKKSTDLKPYERFVINVSNEYGCKDDYLFCEIKDYNEDEFITASSEVIKEEDSSY